MNDERLLILLGNQLFPNDKIQESGCSQVFMAEDYELCTYEKHHKLKILMFLASMREKRDELIKSGYKVNYFDVEHSLFKESYLIKLQTVIEKRNIQQVVLFEVEDKPVENELMNFLKDTDVRLKVLPSPMFKLSRNEFSDFKGHKNTLRMGSFYKDMRKQFDVLLNENNDPIGGRWSFDEDNRKKIPAGTLIPEKFVGKGSSYCESISKSIQKHFQDHPGETNHVWMPLTRSDALAQLDNFLTNKFENFGVYEDAILQSDTFLFHSAISPALNMGLITPDDVLNKSIEFAKNENIPINSLEGFVRQILGWREFMRGIYREHHLV